MFPVGDPPAGGVQCHTKWCGSEHTRHLRIGKTAFWHRQVALVRLGSVWQIVLRTVAQDGLAAHGFEPAGVDMGAPFKNFFWLVRYVTLLVKWWYGSLPADGETWNSRSRQ